MTTKKCPCGSNRSLSSCCGRYIDTDQPAPTAEALMRSRYAAYVLNRTDYLLSTWHPKTRPASLRPTPGLVWLGLTVIQTEAGLENDSEGLVEFEAKYRAGAEPGTVKEASRFEKIDDTWLYIGASE